MRGLIPIVLSEDQDEVDEEDFDSGDLKLQRERDLARIKRNRVRTEARKSDAFQELMVGIREDLTMLSRSMRTNRRSSKPHKPDNPVLVVHL